MNDSAYKMSSSTDIETLLAEIEGLKSQLSDIITGVDTFWVLWGGAMVFFMQVGFLCLEVGSTSIKHTKNLVIKNLLDMCCGTLGWWILGNGIAFGPATWAKNLVGASDFLNENSPFYTDWINNPTANKGDDGRKFAIFFYQWTFCITSVTIMSGAVGERITLAAYCIFSMIMSAVIYPVVTRWCWSSDGWATAFRPDGADTIFGCGVVDFSGSGVVHYTGGLCAFIFILLLGPREGRFINGRAMDLPKQSIVLQGLGFFILWFGWFGFNGSSTLKIVGKAHVAAKIVSGTSMAAATAGVATAAIDLVLYGITSPESIINGTLTGLVAITAGCATTEIEGAFLIGMVAGPLYLFASHLIVRWKIDDMVDATPVHMAGGIWGMIAVGIFSSREAYAESYYADRAKECCGLLYCGNANQLAAQICVVLAITAWVGVMATSLALIMRWLGIFRVSRKVELQGSDVMYHGGEEIPERLAAVLKELATLKGGGGDAQATPSQATPLGSPLNSTHNSVQRLQSPSGRLSTSSRVSAYVPSRVSIAVTNNPS